MARIVLVMAVFFTVSAWRSDFRTHYIMPAGRPCKLTKKVQDRLCHSIKLGATYDLACNSAGISYDIFRQWMRKGEKETSGKFFALFNAVKKAEGEAVDKWLEIIDNAAEDGNWPAAAWKLERRYPGAYGKRIQQKTENLNLDIDVSDLTDEQLQRLANGENLADVVRKD